MLRKLFRLVRRILLLAVIAALALLATSPFYIYDRFNQETPIARLEFEQLDDYAYLAHLSHGDFCESSPYTLLGDQFQLDAGFVKWKGLAILLGFEPRYRLDRLSGRYQDVALENTRPGESHDLAPDVLFDFFAENSPDGDSGWLIDTSYGSSVYQGIDVTRRYTVYATEDGLILRTEEIRPFAREDGQLLIEISRGCGGKPPLLQTLSEKANALATAVIH